MAGLAAAGAAAGTAIMPGIGTAIGGIAGALLDGEMSKGGGSGTGPAGTSSAAVAVYGSGLNADNWFVNFAGTQSATGNAEKSLSATGPTATTAAMGGTIMPPPSSGLGLDLSGVESQLQAVPLWAWAIVGGLLIWRLKSRK